MEGGRKLPEKHFLKFKHDCYVMFSILNILYFNLSFLGSMASGVWANLPHLN